MAGVDAIRWMKGESYLMYGTTGAVNKLGASSAGDPLTQTNVMAKLQAAVGSKAMAAKMCADYILFVQRGGTILNAVQYDYYSDKYQVRNLTRAASHITLGETRALSGITCMDFQSEPFKILWAVRADGVLLGLTFEPQEQIFAWCRIETDGEFESVAVLREDDNEDQVWVSVKRTLNGTVKRCIEYFTPHEIFGQIKDAHCVDCGLSWSGGPSVAITSISNGSPCVITTETPLLSGDGTALQDGDFVRCSGTGTWLDDNVVMVYAPTPLSETSFYIKDEEGTAFIDSSPLYLPGGGVVYQHDFPLYESGGTIQIVRKTFAGLDHLEGEEVQVVVDGGVREPLTVTSGSITLDDYVNKVVVGLGYVCDIETMPLEPGKQDGTSRGKRKKIIAAYVSFFESAGGYMGTNENDIMPVDYTATTVPTMFTGEKRLDLHSDWTEKSGVFIRQSDPLPMTVLSVAPEVVVGNV